MMMERLWAPWRLQYYRDKDNCPDCVFCLAEGCGDDRERYVLRRGRHAYVMLNKYPFMGGHLLIIPFRHIADLADLTDAEGLELHQLARASARILRQALHPSGFNLGLNLGVDGGAGICEHLHYHLVPRWRGDTNFMPMLAEVRILPQHLDETFNLLAPLFSDAVIGDQTVPLDETHAHD